MFEISGAIDAVIVLEWILPRELNPRGTDLAHINNLKSLIRRKRLSHRPLASSYKNNAAPGGQRIKGAAAVAQIGRAHV